MGGSCDTQWGMRNAYTVPVRNLKGRDHLGDPGRDGKIII